ncbi:MAG: sigma 54-interacting transcriptional regulator, partial [Bacillota bacterium]
MREIVCIAPYRELAHMVERVAAELAIQVDVMVGRMETGVEMALTCQAEGAEVLISRGATTWWIHNAAVSLPVVDIPITGYDLLDAYYRARELGHPIGITDLPEVLRGAESLEEIVGQTFIKFPLPDYDQIERGIAALKAAGARVVIGKIVMASLAERYGMRGVTINSGREAVAVALEDASRVLQVRKVERQRAEQIKAILDFAYEGIVAVDASGRVTVFNPVAERIMQVRARDVIGRPAAEVIPNTRLPQVLGSGKPELGEIQDLGKTRIVTNRVPILVNGRIAGVVATFQEVGSIQRLEQNIRRKLAARGHVARWTFADIQGESPSMKHAIRQAHRFAQVDSTVLITAETGTGKEMFAQAIHLDSPRHDGPFVAVNCAALADELLESELFGYAEGAFTGARRGGKPGLFELAHGGTIFLDEIAEMSERLQAKVLRVLEQHEVARLGDDRVIPVDVRVIAATNRNLADLVRQGRFRDDLYYRLNVLRLSIPPLRERKEDVPILARAILRELHDRYGRGPQDIPPEALALLGAWDWPGNVRELRNLVERLAILTDGPTLERDAIAAVLDWPALASPPASTTALAAGAP